MKTKIKILFLLVFCVMIFGVLDVTMIHAQGIENYKLAVPLDNLKVLSSPSVGPCSDGSGEQCTSIPWIGQYVVALYEYGIKFATLIAVLMLVVGGIMYILAGGQPALAGKAKSTMTAAVFGLVIVVGSYLILVQVNPKLTNLNAIEVQSVKTVAFTCCENTNDPADVQVIDKSTDSSGNTSGGCQSGYSETSMAKCTSGATLGSPCCTTPTSRSYKDCQSLGGECLPVTEAPCLDIAEAVAWTSVAVTGVGALGGGASVSAVNYAGKTLSYGLKVAKAATGEVISGSVACAFSTVCVGAVGTAAIMASMTGESCSQKMGICQRVETKTALEDGQMCKTDNQCASDNCCTTQKALQCWGVSFGYCASGGAGQVNAQGTGTCSVDKAGKTGSEACCNDGVTCAYYFNKHWLGDTKFASCSTGQLGEACGGAGNICAAAGLICDPTRKICSPSDGILPPGATLTCNSTVDCKKTTPNTFCSLDNKIQCDTHGSKSGCVPRPTAGTQTCMNRYVIGEACIDDLQCLSDNCVNNVCACEAGTALGCLDNKICKIDSGVSSCVDSGAPGTLFKNTETCSSDSECISNDCSARPLNSLPVCDCDTTVTALNPDANPDYQCLPGWTCLSVESGDTCYQIATLKKPGEDCSEDAECNSNECSSANKCVCNDTGQCQDDNPYCVSGVCRDGELGSACDDYNDCASGTDCGEFGGKYRCVPTQSCLPAESHCDKYTGYGGTSDCPSSEICDCTTSSSCNEGRICVDGSRGNDPCVLPRWFE